MQEGLQKCLLIILWPGQAGNQCRSVLNCVAGLGQGLARVGLVDFWIFTECRLFEFPAGVKS